MMEILKKYYSVSLKKIYHLLLLISFFATSNVISSEDNYVVQKGDTLWSISRSFDVSITQLLSLNTIETFANGIPLIKEGDKIILSNISEIAHLAYCRDPKYNYYFNFSELPNDEARLKCYEILEKELDPHVIGESSSKLSLSDDNKFLRKWDSKDKPKLDKRFWDIYLSDNRNL